MTTAAQNAVAQAAALAVSAPNETITLSGDVTGSGTTAITATLATVNSNTGKINGVTTNGKGLVTANVARAKVQTTQIATSVPLTTSATSDVAMGLATTAVGGAGNVSIITPEATGNIFVSITFNAQTATGTDYGEAVIQYGTGSPPVAGTGAGGLVVGSGAAWGNTNAAGNTPYFMVTLSGIILGATIGTALWFDLAWLNGVGARAIYAYDVSALAFEI